MTSRSRSVNDSIFVISGSTVFGLLSSWIMLPIIERSMMGSMIQELNKPNTVDPEITKIESLTDREREVIALVGEGLKNKQVGERLFISETTVTHHLSSVFSKLDVSDRLELIIYAFRHGLAKMPK